MKPVPRLLVLVVLFAGCQSVDDGPADHDAALPDSIADAVRAAYPGQRVVLHERRPFAPGGPAHRVTLDRRGLRTWVIMDDTGRILRERAELSEADVPAGILGTVRREFPDQDIPLVIRWRERERIHYEIRLLDPSGLTSSLNITPAGMIIEDIDGEGVPGPTPEEG